MEPSVVEETRDRGQRCLRSVHIDEQEVGLRPPSNCVCVGATLRHSLVELACRTGDDIRPAADLAELKVVFMTGETRRTSAASKNGSSASSIS